MSPEQPDRGMHAASDVDHDDQREGRRELLIGAIILAVGLAVTIGSYIAAGSAAQESGSGTYVVTWGLIAVGAVKTVKGLYRMLN